MTPKAYDSVKAMFVNMWDEYKKEVSLLGRAMTPTECKVDDAIMDMLDAEDQPGEIT